MELTFASLDLTLLIGKDKQSIMNEFGHGYNDFLSDVWMYRLEYRNFLSKKYLYLFFENGLVKKVKFKRILYNNIM